MRGPLGFTKLHGLGNDYVLLDGFREGILPEDLLPALARSLCDRHRGVGGDGLLLLLPGTDAPLRMRIFNPDGSEAEMCGNGIRCLALYAYGEGYAGERFLVETAAGARKVEVFPGGAVRVDMGPPGVGEVERPLFSFRATTLSLGNPHCVIFSDREEEVGEWGPRIENHPLFPQRTNVEFARVVSPDRLVVRVWERGVGETLACGTGACAAVVAGAVTGRTERKARVELPGGELEVEWREEGRVFLTGPAREVFRGVYFPDEE